MKLPAKRALSAMLAVGVAGLVAGGHGSTASATGANLRQLNSELGASQFRSADLAASLRALSAEIGTLSRQIGFVQQREADVRVKLAADRTRLAADQSAVAGERARVAKLRQELSHARTVLVHQLVSSYESSQPDLISVVLDAHGFNQLLEQLNFLGRAEHRQQALVIVTRAAKERAIVATQRLTALEQRAAASTRMTGLQARALAGMDTLLRTRQSALAHAQAAQAAALAAERARGASLRAAITRVHAQQAAAARAAAALAATATNGQTLGAAAGWAIPYPIVLCESGGQNLPPNGAGASGYYQIIPATWRQFGGTGPAAYLTSKSEQDAVAARIWAGGAGASNWVCAGILGIH